MVEGLIGKKVGMTQVFDEDGTVAPVTVIEAGPCVVVQRKTQRTGRLRGGAARVWSTPRRPSGPPSRMRGHHEKAGVPPTRLLREFRLLAESELKPGDRGARWTSSRAWTRSTSSARPRARASRA